MPGLSFQIVHIDSPAYDGVWALREEVLRKPLGLSLLDEDLSAEINETTIAAIEPDGSVLGCVMMRRVSDEEVKLRQMAVATELQGQGIGNGLLQQAEELAKSQGYIWISLHARLSAVLFYEKAGYVGEGDVFTEVGIPHLVMKKQVYAPLP
jgi:predicted GNAT family N-acyltransferase